MEQSTIFGTERPDGTPSNMFPLFGTLSQTVAAPGFSTVSNVQGKLSAMDRLKSFETWPKYLRPTKEEMASAGFVYTGQSDRVVCFACKREMKDWSPDDIPLHEHYKWSKECEYLRIVYVPSVLPQRTPFTMPWRK